MQSYLNLLYFCRPRSVAVAVIVAYAPYLPGNAEKEIVT